jgi:hypothetical protein
MKNPLSLVAAILMFIAGIVLVILFAIKTDEMNKRKIEKIPTESEKNNSIENKEEIIVKVIGREEFGFQFQYRVKQLNSPIVETYSTPQYFEVGDTIKVKIRK